MAAASGTSLLGESVITDEYKVNFYNKDEEVLAKVYKTDKKIHLFVLKGLSIGPWTYETLPSFARSQVDQILEKEGVQIKVKKAASKALAGASEQESPIDSDDDLSEFIADDLVLFEKEANIHPIAMTISCPDQNIKGSTLIEIVHDDVQDRYGEVIDYACEYEKEVGGTMIPPPKVEDGVLFLERPREWLMSLGGWKGMMPSEEVKDYFFAREKEKFNGVQIYQNGLTFPIIDHRVHLPKGFSIGGFDVTTTWEKKEDKWTEIPGGKTDLSYVQIVKGIEKIKEAFKLSDSQIAGLQLSSLSGAISYDQIPKGNRKEVRCFLDYLNSLMFGIEPSGLNAGLTIGLMILDLISDKTLTYETAFKANAEGGFYPYACFGKNKGTYTQRESILVHKKEKRTSLSMKKFRENLSLSPVAIKEAILIKTWLESNKALLKDAESSVQIERITRAIGDLTTYYFSPWVKREYLLEKFAKES